MTSCSNQTETTQTETTSLQVSINFSDIARQAPASDDDDTSDTPSSNYRAVVKLSGDTGDIMGVKWIENATSDNNTVTFDSVPVGANVEIEANMFNRNQPDSVNSHIYNGKSGNFRVKSGINKVTLPMKNLSISEDATPVYTAETMKTTFNGKEYGDFLMSFYENGKFILAQSEESYGSTYLNIISQGIWSGTSDVFKNGGGTISITEYVFKEGLSFNGDTLTFESVCYSAGFSKNIKITVTDETCNFSFESGGLTFSTVSN